MSFIDDMENLKLIKNYAKALFHSARNKNKIPEILTQLESINDIIQSNTEIKSLFDKPIISKKVKINIINKLTETCNIDEDLKNFLLITIENSRETILPTIAEYYKNFTNEHNNIKIVEITSAKLLNQNDRKDLQNYVEKELIHQQCQIEFNEDESLIGGILIKYDSNLIDLSIANKLKKIKNLSRKIASN